MSTLPLETVARFRALAEAQLAVADWQDADGDTAAAVGSYDEALTSIQYAIEAMPADGRLKREEFEEIQAPLFLVRARIGDRRSLSVRQHASQPRAFTWGDPEQCERVEDGVAHAYVRRVRRWTGAVIGVYLTVVVFLLGALQIVLRAPRSQWFALGALTGTMLVVYAAVILLALWGWHRAVGSTGSPARTAPAST